MIPLTKSNKSNFMKNCSRPAHCGPFEVESSGELPSHSAGPEMMLLDGTVSKRVEVSRFLDKLGSIKDIPVGTCAMAYALPGTSEVIIIIFGETLYFGEQLSHSLLCPKSDKGKWQRSRGYAAPT